MSVPSPPRDAPSADPDAQSSSSASKADIRRGFLWLGGASAIARVLDALSVVVVMWFTSREQLGLATLAWSVAVFMEAMNGFGIGASILQAREVSPARLASAFWYTMGLAALLTCSISACSPLIARWLDEPSLVPLIAISSLKLPFVGAALIPLTLLNRATRFESIAAVQTGATFGASIVTCTLLVLGFDAWGLVIGQTSHGLFTAVLAHCFHPYRPQGPFDRALSRDDISFGIKITASGALYHFYRNFDYYLIARFLGVGAVGVYRVAFDLAMTPTLAVLAVVSRSALPVYARLNERRSELREAFLWTLRSLTLVLAPITAALMFAAEDLLHMIDGGKWLAAAPMVRWLAVAALLRCIAQTFPQVFQAVRRPALALYDSLLMTGLIGLSLTLLLQTYGPTHGALSAAWAWTLVYPIELAVLTWMIGNLIGLKLGELLHSIQHGLWMLVAAGFAHVLLARLWPASVVGGPRAAAELTVVAAVSALYLRVVLGLKLGRGLLRRGST